MAVQWLRARSSRGGGIPGHSGGSAPDSHRLPLATDLMNGAILHRGPSDAGDLLPRVCTRPGSVLRGSQEPAQLAPGRSQHVGIAPYAREHERAFERGDGEVGALRRPLGPEAVSLQARAQGRQPALEARVHRGADRLAARRDLQRGGRDRAATLEPGALQPSGEQAGERLDGADSGTLRVCARAPRLAR